MDDMDYRIVDMDYTGPWDFPKFTFLPKQTSEILQDLLFQIIHNQKLAWMMK